MTHYLHTTDEHFEKAVQVDGQQDRSEGLQNVMQPMQETPGDVPQAEMGENPPLSAFLFAREP